MMHLLDVSASTKTMSGLFDCGARRLEWPPTRAAIVSRSKWPAYCMYLTSNLFDCG